jgi:hypothetical protein
MNRPPVLDTDRCSEQDVVCFHPVQPYLARASFWGLHASFSGRLLRYLAVAYTLAPKVLGLGTSAFQLGLHRAALFRALSNMPNKLVFS